MGANSLIQWTDHTFNPWRGCHKISEGCKNCYAASFVVNRQGLKVWGQDAPRQVAAESTWKNPEKWNREAEQEGVRRRVFCASLADVFEEYMGPDAAAVAYARQRLFALIKKTPHLLWLLLTKRPENVRAFVPDQWLWDADFCSACAKTDCDDEEIKGVRVHVRCGSPMLGGWPSNAWIGFTAENQARFDERWERAKHIPAPVIFTSIEPQIGPVVLPADYLARGQRVWPFIGGESGPGARTFDLQWARDIIAQCQSAGVPAFMKQAGSRPYSSNKVQDYPGRKVFMWAAQDTLEQKLLLDFDDKKGGEPLEWPEDLRVRQIPEAA